MNTEYSLRPLIWPTPSLAGLRLQEIPLRIGEWRADDTRRLDDPPGWTVLPDELWREYRSASGERVSLFVGRLGHPLGRPGDLAYLTDVLWRIENVSVPSPHGRARDAKQGLVMTRTSRTRVVYWYRLGGSPGTNRVLAKLYGAWCAVTK
ncbi:MAG: exosortase-associated EpsI family protein, partial [Planctomycetota bacterium]